MEGYLELMPVEVERVDSVVEVVYYYLHNVPGFYDEGVHIPVDEGVSVKPSCGERCE